MAPEPEPSTTASDLKTISLEECRKHMTDKSCWLVVHGKVYDVTDFLEEHPGGYDIIVTATGVDSGEGLRQFLL